MSNWKPHFYRVGSHAYESDSAPSESKEIDNHRKRVEPWLSAVFQSEHLSLLLGNGFTTACAAACKTHAASMGTVAFKTELSDKIEQFATRTAEESGRGKPNIEDQIRAANQLITGLEILGDPRLQSCRDSISAVLTDFLSSILASEASIEHELKLSEAGLKVQSLLVSFVLSFASRTASRERLNIFTTNYDRLIEYVCDLAGVHIMDRFVGHLRPVFRSSRLSVDLHYNPPGIRGEPRYMEGVIRFTKLHGSLDWRWEDRQLRRYGIPFGAPKTHPDLPKKPRESVMIYPNAAKDFETVDHPYAELFRDFSASLCRPNSAVVVYGYGFGDDHINRVIADMLTIPSTHLTIVAYADPEGRIRHFCEVVGHSAQITILFGGHFANLPDLVENYLPKPAIDPISGRRAELLKNRGIDPMALDKETAGGGAETESQE